MPTAFPLMGMECDLDVLRVELGQVSRIGGAVQRQHSNSNLLCSTTSRMNAGSALVHFADDLADIGRRIEQVASEQADERLDRLDVGLVDLDDRIHPAFAQECRMDQFQIVGGEHRDDVAILGIDPVDGIEEPVHVEGTRADGDPVDILGEYERRRRG